MSPKPLIPETGWAKIGPGRGSGFRMATGELQQLLLDSLVREFRPYQLVTQDFHGRDLGWKATEHNVEELETLCSQGESDFFIRSLVLHPTIDWAQFRYPHGVCSLNGMIHLRHNYDGLPSLPSDIGIVWKVGNLTTYEVVVHEEYLKIFEALRRAIRKAKAHHKPKQKKK